MHFNNIKSGWTVIVKILSETLEKKVDSLITIAAQIIDEIFARDRSLENLSEVFVEIIEIQCNLILNSTEAISLNSMQYLSRTLDYLVS